MLLLVSALVGFIFVGSTLLASPINTTTTGRRSNGNGLDRGSYARLNRLKSRASIHSLDPKGIDNNELVQLLHKSAFQRVDQRSPLVQKLRSYQLQLNRTSYEGIDACIPPISLTLPLRVVVFVDSSFFSIFQNWLLYFVRVCGTASIYAPSSSNLNLEIVCVDQDVSTKLDFLNLRCSKYSSYFLNNKVPNVPLSRQQSSPSGRYLREEEEEIAFRSSLWVVRMRVIHSMLSENWDVILCDVDALWNNDPFPSISSAIFQADQGSTKVAIISSQGKWPPEVSDMWGSALCMGFILLRNNPLSRSLLASILSKWSAMEQYGPSPVHQKSKMDGKGWVRWDDQYAMNVAVFESLVQWKPMESGPVDLKNKRTSKSSWWKSTFGKDQSTVTVPKPLLNASLSYIGSIRIQTEIANLVLLPRTSFVRHCLLHPFHGNMTQKLVNRERVAELVEDDQTKVIHCIGGMRTSGSAVNKIKFLKELGLWMLQEQTDLF